MELKVYLNSSSTKPVFQRIVTTPDGLDVDYSGLIKSMRQLFGNECIVEFKIY